MFSRFTVNHAWVDVRVFNSGMMSIKCVTYNHDVIEILKQWRNEGGGQYNQKYKSWNYFKPFSDTVFQRLQEMDSSPKQWDNKIYITIKALLLARP